MNDVVFQFKQQKDFSDKTSTSIILVSMHDESFTKDWI